MHRYLNQPFRIFHVSEGFENHCVEREQVGQQVRGHEKVGLNESGGIDRVFKPTFSRISRFMHPTLRIDKKSRSRTTQGAISRARFACEIFEKRKL